jgi:GTP pyrophosphokinase
VKTTPPKPSSATRRAAEVFAALHALELADGAPKVVDDAIEVAQIIAGLEADEDLVVAAAIYPLISHGWLTRERAIDLAGPVSAKLARDLAQLGQFGLPADWSPEKALEQKQAEALRKMLLAVVSDVRLVVVRLAEQLHALRLAKNEPAAEQRRLALECREVYAPLANRLGVWQVKWELEDLAFRYLQPADYRRIAAELKARRSEREQYINDLQATLHAELAANGVHADISGRPKHIFSIYRKMQRKQVAFDQLTDIRAVRILTNSVADCYAALGVVHTLWPFIPGEFDDYIATPKDNLYRSIHTAVIGPGGEPVEVQIRTHEMHAHAERGVAAHWRYKEGGKGDQAYERKINQLRTLLSPAEADHADADFLERMRIDLFQDRVYVLSPKGEIVDVPVGGTPLDFAYQLHTDLGHRTRGAKVNGRMVPLDYRLSSGETVEIVTSKTLQPSRDWLSPQSGFLASPRNRNKVRTWFRKQDASLNTQAGRGMLERELQRLGVASPPLPEILRELRIPTTDALHEALGMGDVTLAQVTGAIQRLHHAHTDEARRDKPPAAAPASKGLAVQGVGDLLSVYAKCCKPVPPEPIAGYVTVGRGVSIHKADCASFLRLQARNPARALQVDWGRLASQEFPVDIDVEAYDRRGLVKDVSTAITEEKISIRGMNTVTAHAVVDSHYGTAAALSTLGAHLTAAERHSRQAATVMLEVTDRRWPRCCSSRASAGTLRRRSHPS